ncbi:MarR family transcriptional regulator [Prosthecodimorpha staleyi]|uniref:Winged helix DNA-binding protein n=1 Tax=Prosthecodimorpha staleyi TaxID=2840188 RepID=A0A947D2C6_9HYPH|nr:helix-turn-helix domain-containing protein [Prosthecodimorpha staleyi]MBT9289678.1 winged helix DNA-binding protein [Prosthecodimorpha staleyi]
MPFQQVQTLLLVSMYPGITLSELADRLEIAQSSASRNVAALGKVHRLQKEGLDFVEAIEDPSERRRKICFLTERGHREVLGLMRMLYPDFNFDAGPTAKERIDNVMSSLRKRR